MAAPVRVEAEAFSDPRIQLLAELAGWSRYEALGRMAHLWSACTERQLYVVPEPVIRGTLGPNGIQLLLESDLGERVGGGIRVRGTDGRIEWLGDFREQHVAAGRARAATAQRDAKGRLVASSGTSAGPAVAGVAGPAQPAEVQRSSSGHPAESSPLTLSPSLSLTQKNQNEGRVSTSSTPPPSKSKGPKAVTDQEQRSVRVVLDRLSERSRIKYRGGAEHTKLIVGRLRDGYTEWDLRRVVGYCAEKLGWENDPKMHAFLRPETLFGSQTIAKYVDAARTWAPQDAPPDEPEEDQRGPVVLFDSVGGPDYPQHPRWEEPSWMS